MKKFLFTLVLGILFVGTMTATETADKESPDIVYQMEMPDAPMVTPINLEADVATVDVGKQEATDNMIYVATQTNSEIGNPENSYRYDANSRRSLNGNKLTFKEVVQSPDIKVNRLL